eukprot:g20859.t1
MDEEEGVGRLRPHYGYGDRGSEEDGEDGMADMRYNMRYGR